jgi:hypothetical protein
MFHSPNTARTFRILSLALALSVPAVAKDKGPPVIEGAALDRACANAFGRPDEFSWTPRMGIVNAVATCERAMAQSPDNPDVQFGYAVARDQFAERGGEQADNIYATKVYRKLAGEGHALATYALATMFDEDTGITEDQARRILEDAVAGEYGPAVQCDTLRTFAYSSIDNSDAPFDMATAEALAVGSPVCAGVAASMFWRSPVGEYELTGPLDSYVRYAATHGDFMAMAVLGLFYADGTDSTTIPDPLKGEYTAVKDTERAGYWMLLSYWGSSSVMQVDEYDSYWGGQMLVDPLTTGAMQAGLKGLGLLDGPVDGKWGEGSAGALEAFMASGEIDALFQRVRALETIDSELGTLGAAHIDTAAIAEAAGR